MLADFSQDTFNVLQAKHPPPHPDSDIPPPPPPNLPEGLEISELDIIHAIRSFPCGSAGGPDKLCPQHLKDLLQSEATRLLATLATRRLKVQPTAMGRTPPLFLFRATRVAPKKKGLTTSGVSPRSIKLQKSTSADNSGLSDSFPSDMAQLLAPRQLGYSVRGGSEAAVHAGRCFLNNMSTEQAMVKLDFANAFNSVRRDRMLDAVQGLCPAIYTFVQWSRKENFLGGAEHYLLYIS